MMRRALRILLSTCAVFATLLAAGHLNMTGTQNSDQDRLERLAQRVECYYALHAAKKYGEAYDMLASRLRGNANDRREWVAECAKASRHVRHIEWSIASIRLNADMSRVEMLNRYKIRRWLFLGWQDTQLTEVDFWMFENGDWYLVPLVSTEASRWTDNGAVDVKPPTVQAGCPGEGRQRE